MKRMLSGFEYAYPWVSRSRLVNNCDNIWSVRLVKNWIVFFSILLSKCFGDWQTELSVMAHGWVL